MITKRTLEKWRKEALEVEITLADAGKKILVQRIIKMTQELLDQHLLVK